MIKKTLETAVQKIVAAAPFMPLQNAFDLAFAELSALHGMGVSWAVVAEALAEKGITSRSGALISHRHCAALFAVSKSKNLRNKLPLTPSALHLSIAQTEMTASTDSHSSRAEESRSSSRTDITQSVSDNEPIIRPTLEVKSRSLTKGDRQRTIAELWADKK